MNSEMAAKVSRNSFEQRYASNPDPWKFESSLYEQNRYDCVIRALGRETYDAVYEPGCSVGALTARLSAIAGRVVAVDIAPTAVEHARNRCRKLLNVEVRCESVATYLPPAPFDLIVFSEIGYYFDAEDLAKIAATLADRLELGGEFLAVHWLGHSEDHVLHGDEVHEILKNALSLTSMKSEVHRGFRIDTWSKR